MPRPARIALELLGPTLIAVVLAYASFLVLFPGEVQLGAVPGALAEILPFAFGVAAAPSFVFTLVMEVAFARGLAPRSGWAVALAAGLGALSGLGVNVLTGDASHVLGSFLAVLGFTTGSIIGIAIFVAARLADRRAARARPDLSSVF